MYSVVNVEVMLQKDRQARLRNIEARLCNFCCLAKAINITYSEFVSVALVIQHSMPMRHILLSSVACPALP
jgi:hypothetical protein